MEAEFWHGCWDKNHIGFHQLEFHPWLADIVPLQQAPHLLVPLCGKSLDMVFFSRHYQQVHGAELSDLACAQFFEEQQVTPQITRQGEHQCYQAGNICLWQGDFFELTLPMQSVDIFDRAALIALPPAMRTDYINQLRQLMPEGRLFLLILDYPDGEIQGPPFNITEQQVREYFSFAKSINKLSERDLTGQRFAQRQLSSSRLTEMMFVIDW